MIIFKKNLSLFLTFMFLISMLPKLDIKAKADSLPLPAADLSVTLVGNFIKLNELGEDWLETNAQTLMKEYKGGIYEFTVNFKAAMPLGEYKVVLNRSWDEGYGNGTENKKINVTAPGKVIIRYNSKTKTVYDSINDPLQFKSAANLVGYFLQCGGKDWDPADTTYALDYMGGGFYKKTFTLKAGTYEYKTAYNSGWNQGEVADNVKISLTKDTEVTFIANPLEGICTDSINTPLILGSVSLIGTIRNVGDPANTDITSKGFDFSNLTGDGKYIYSGFFKEGSYQYKGLENYAWTSGGLPAGANIDITIPKGGKYVVFIGDRAARTMIDSVNNPALVTEALGLKPVPVVPVELRSPVVNNNGTVTFNYMDATATKVCLAGSMNAWSATSIPMAKTDTEKNIWSVTVTLANPAKVYEYKFVVDGILKQDPLNIPKTGDNSILNYTGRKIVLAGTIQTIAGDKANWDPTSVNTKLNFDGNGNYSLTLKNVPIGNYEYKIAMGSWDENYGADGIRDGANIKLVVPVQEDITFWYNDISHKIADSTYYKQVNVDLKGTGIPADTKLTDKSLTGVYSTTVNLKIGTYSDIKAVLEAKEYSFGKVVVSTDKDVTFSIDTKSLMTFSDASDIKVAVDKLYFNSRDSEYKSPYGATPTDTDITFNLKTGTDVTTAKIVMITSKGIKLIDMTANSTNDKWTGHFSSSTLGQFKYYFVVSNGSDLKAYGDDDGFFGPGKAGQLGTVGNYDLNIYDKNFKTPDWMKNAVVYQIFPDRFFNGDTSNDYAQTSSRGDISYESNNSWYNIPENPTLEFITNADGTKIPNPDYKGTKGDGNWSNDMAGGDLKGIQAKLNYLQALGVNTLYMNPISQSISNHRYDTTDYKNLDPLLGNTEDFVNLATEAKKRKMHLILDGVFNHVSDDSIYFDRYGKYMAKGKPIGAYQYWSMVYDLMNLNTKITLAEAETTVTADLITKGITDLHYKDWFVVNNKKIAAVTGDPAHYDYEGWYGYDSMPVIQALNGSEYNIKSWADEIIDGPKADTRLWLKNGASGWRLDASETVSDATWRKFRAAVKSESKEDIIVGEIWVDSSNYLLGDMFDTVMNYRFKNAVIAYVQNKATNNMDAVQAMNQLEAMREQYPKEAFEAMMNIVDSHDTQRIISTFDHEVSTIADQASATALAKIRLIPLIQMTYPGAPTIYYGDEAAMTGDNDPDNRRGMIWGKGDQKTVEWYAKLANIRNAYPVLRTGDILPIVVDDTNKADVMAYTRNDGKNHAVIGINRKATAINGVVFTANAPNGTEFTNALNNSEKYTVVNGKVTVNLPSYSGVILVAKYKAVKVNTSALKDIYDSKFIVQDKVRVTGITIDTNSTELKIGNKLALNAKITPTNATLTKITWTSSDEKIATVDKSGKVVGIRVGSAAITATTLDGNFKALCKVNVVKPSRCNIPEINNGFWRMNKGTGLLSIN